MHQTAVGLAISSHCVAQLSSWSQCCKSIVGAHLWGAIFLFVIPEG